MKRLCVCALLLLSSAAAVGLTKKEAKAIYDADKQKVLSGDLSFDWQQFRLASVQGGTEYFDWHPLRTEALQKLQSGDASGALKVADDIIGHDMAEPEGHLLAMMAYRDLNKADAAAYQRKIVDAWVKSLQASGDGKSAAAAFVVVDEGEEYMYLNLIRGVGLPQSQSLVNQNGHAYDLMKIKDEAGKEEDVWFNIDVPFAKESEIFGGKKN